MAVSEKLSFSDVTFAYEQKQLLQEFQLAIAKGEFVSIIGPSGVGKSTVFQLAAGLLQPTSGAIMLDGEPAVERLGKVAYMPQKDLLMPWRTVLDNAALPLEIQGIPRSEAMERVIDLLPRFGLSDWVLAYPDQLSGGMRQRVSFLRAVLTGCDLLLLDEPFSALDGITRIDMQEWLLDMWQDLGTTILMITHDIDEAVLLADRVLILCEDPRKTAIEIEVTIKRPRTAVCRYEAGFLAIREQIWKLLREGRDA